MMRRLGRRDFLGRTLALPLAAAAWWLRPAPVMVVRAAAAVTATIRPEGITGSISPLIYGLSWEHNDLRPALQRWGGNFSTRYNWELGSAFNTAADWEYRNVDYGGGASDRQPSGMADNYLAAARQLGTAVLLTVPAVGWVARDTDPEHRSVGVPSLGNVAIAPSADGGRGRHSAITGYDPSFNRDRTSLRSLARKRAPFQFPPDPHDSVVYQDEWIHHLVTTFGPANTSPGRLYAIDNEPDLWSYTHRDVHPARMGYSDMLNVFLEYATAIKDVDPTARVIGPGVAGWTWINFSELDRGEGQFKAAPERALHGGQPFLAWFLQQVRAHDEATGRRTLDILDVHWYPQNGEYSGNTEPTVAARRLRTTRQLWDPTYGDESWIGGTSDVDANGAVRLIPRLREWVSKFYPGTGLGISEWNYGADDTLNGALALADALGIFGREGLELAAYWRAPKAGSPGGHAFRLYRDFDGAGGTFGDQALLVERDDGHSGPVSIYASRDNATAQLKVMLINKQPDAPANVTLTLAGLSGTAALYRYDAANLGAIVRLADQRLSGDQLPLELPAYSLTLAVVPLGRGGR